MSDNDKDKAREIVCSPNAIDFLSSEESDNDDPAPSSGPKPRKVRKLVWEKSKLKNLKANLDEVYLEGLSEIQRRTTAHLSRTEESSVRPCPTNGPRYKIRRFECQVLPHACMLFSHPAFVILYKCCFLINHEHRLGLVRLVATYSN